MNSPELLWETAEAVSEHLKDGIRRRRKVKLPANRLRNLQSLVRPLNVARERSWHGATAQLHRRLMVALTQLRETVHRGSLPPATSRGLTASSQEIYEDLSALIGEFAAVEITPEQYRIAVTTGPVILNQLDLNQLDLGPFEIRLDWGAIGRDRCYRVMAASPHPPASDECVTHPYVRDDLLCAGDAEPSIEMALQQGRLFDFFTLVRQLLVNYVPGRSFVELDEWNWMLCEACGTLVERRQLDGCQRCRQTLCVSCTSRCAACERTCCGSCSRWCAICRHRFCKGCLDRCVRCSAWICADCHWEGLCTSCRQEAVRTSDHDVPQAA